MKNRLHNAALVFVTLPPLFLILGTIWVVNRYVDRKSRGLTGQKQNLR